VNLQVETEAKAGLSVTRWPSMSTVLKVMVLSVTLMEILSVEELWLECASLQMTRWQMIR